MIRLNIYHVCTYKVYVFIMNVCVYVCMYVCVWVCVCVYVCVYVCVCVCGGYKCRYYCSTLHFHMVIQPSETSITHCEVKFVSIVNE